MYWFVFHILLRVLLKSSRGVKKSLQLHAENRNSLDKGRVTLEPFIILVTIFTSLRWYCNISVFALHNEYGIHKGVTYAFLNSIRWHCISRLHLPWWSRPSVSMHSRATKGGLELFHDHGSVWKLEVVLAWWRSSPVTCIQRLDINHYYNQEAGTWKKVTRTILHKKCEHASCSSRCFSRSCAINLNERTDLAAFFGIHS